MVAITNTLISPGINVSEVDLTTVVPRLGTTVGAIAGMFPWGPMQQRILIGSESQLVATYGEPNSNNAETFFTAANFLSYGNSLYVVRAGNTTSGDANAYLSAAANGGTLTAGNTSAITVLNEIDFSNKKANNYAFDANAMFVAKFPGALGNSLKVSICDSVNGYNSNVNMMALPGNTVDTTVTLGVSSGNTTVTVTDTSNLKAGLVLYSVSNTGLGITSNVTSIVSVTNTTAFVINATPSATNAAATAAFITGKGAADTTLTLTVQSGNTSVAVSDTTGLKIGTVLYSVSNTGLGITSGVTAITNVVNSTVFIINATPSATNAAATAAFITARGIANIAYGASNLTITFASSGTANIQAQNTLATAIASSFTVGDVILLGNNSIGYQYNKIVSIVNTSNTTGTGLNFVLSDTYKLTADWKANTSVNGNTSVVNIQRFWEYQNLFNAAPITSQYVYLNGNTQNWASNTANTPVDSMHVVITDNLGSFTGTPGSVLEVYTNVSRANDSIGQSGQSIFWQNVLNTQSNYVWALNQRSDNTANTGNSATVISGSNNAPFTAKFVGGQDGASESANAFTTIATAYNFFQNPTDVQINLVLQGKPIGGTYNSGAAGAITANNFNLANYLIDNIATTRKDCVVFVTPDDSIVYNNKGNEATALVAWRNTLHSTSYAVMDSGYKYQYDRYNDVYRYVPTNGDIAGLCVTTDLSSDPWYSPAGFNRGQIKNLIRMRYNPSQTDRDLLYANAINPVVTFQGQGTILFGDKTLTNKPSAFDRINVRRLFITIEQAIRTASDYTLFEFNDSFTRSNFVNLITPYLKNIKSLRGITDFYIVCDESNNTPQRIDSNQFWCDIYIKPARSINFIQLNFIAVATGVQFTEVLGQY